MYLLYCDETNLDPGENNFFVYGGIIIHGDTAKNLHDEIEGIRKKSNFPNDFQLKFNPKPPNLSHQQFIQIKQQVVEAAINNRCFFIASIILHRIAKSVGEARRNEINRVIFNFNSFLNRQNGCGLCLIDRFSDVQIDAHLREKFSIGLRGLPYAGDMRLERVMGFHYSAIGQSHFGSVIDIVLGTFRYSINAFSSNDSSKQKSADTLLPLIAPLFLRSDQTDRVLEISLNFSPKIIKADKYRKEYNGLKKFLTKRGIESCQEITATRMY